MGQANSETRDTPSKLRPGIRLPTLVSYNTVEMSSILARVDPELYAFHDEILMNDPELAAIFHQFDGLSHAQQRLLIQEF